MKQVAQGRDRQRQPREEQVLVTLDKQVPLKFDWEGWKRRDWDGQKLLELFHEFGFRGFAERVRKTLAGSGAKKNAEALATAGLATEPLAASREVPGASAVSPLEAAPGPAPAPREGREGKARRSSPRSKRVCSTTSWRNPG